MNFPSNENAMKLFFLIAPCIYLVNITVSFLFTRKYKDNIYKKNMYVWLFYFLFGVSQGVSNEITITLHAKVMIWSFFAFMLQESISVFISEVYKTTHKLKLDFTMCAIGMTVTTALFYVTDNLMFAALPAVFGAAWPTLRLAPLLKTFSTNSFTKIGYLLCSVIIAVHMLDFAYAANKPELMFPGYLIALILTTGLSCFSFAVLIERAIIEVEMKDLLHNTSRLTALGGMAAEIAHEINNPLTVISLNNQQMKHKLQQSTFDPEFMIGKIEVADRMVNRLIKIMQALKSSYRSTEHDTFKQVSLHDLLDDIQFLCQIRTDRMHIDLSIEKNLEEIALECRPTQISQVLQNLVYNALDALEGCEQKWIKISYAVKTPERIEIYVTDSGKGIPPHLRGRIFDNLFTTKPNGKGTGLGLSISKRFIEEHGGFLQLSQTSKNTTFVIDLPMKQNTMDQPGPSKTAAS